MLQNIPKEKILEVVRQGPTIPGKIVKVVGGDTMLIGAILSGMISTGEIKYSSLKIGGSPVYYVPGQESRLEEFVQYLSDKDQKTVSMLKEKKVVEESGLDPLTRVSIKIIKDFAKPFELDNKVFYRYFLVEKSEAEKIASEILKKNENEKKDAKEYNKDVLTNESAIYLSQTQVLETSNNPETSNNVAPAIVSSEAHYKESTQDSGKGNISEEPIPESDEFSSIKRDKKEKKQKHDLRTEEESGKIKKDFFEMIKEYVHKKGLDIISKEKIKKNEYALVLKNHGSNEYIYCVAKDKKTINEGDLSTAFVFSHQKNMPCIFLMTGRLTKKAEMMAQKEFKDITIETI